MNDRTQNVPTPTPPSTEAELRAEKEEEARRIEESTDAMLRHLSEQMQKGKTYPLQLEMNVLGWERSQAERAGKLEEYWETLAQRLLNGRKLPPPVERDVRSWMASKELTQTKTETSATATDIVPVSE